MTEYNDAMYIDELRREIERLETECNNWRDLYAHLCLLLDKHYYHDCITRPVIRGHIVAESWSRGCLNHQQTQFICYP